MSASFSPEPTATVFGRPSRLKARYVFPVGGPPIRDGVVGVCGERIAAVGACGAVDSQGAVDLGNVAILPGLVNAHAHLDFSDLAQPLGAVGIRFVDWVRRVIQFRRESVGMDRRPVERGLQESLAQGTTLLGDIAQADWSREQVAASPVETTVFLELIAPTADRVAAAMSMARSHLVEARTASHWHAGLSPHAPYSVHRDLLRGVVELSAAERIPVAMHLAESPEEMQLLRHGTGPLQELLTELGAWEPSAWRAGARPLDYLRLLTSAHRALVIHGSYLDDAEIALLGANAERMTVVYCPRTYEFFHDIHAGSNRGPHAEREEYNQHAEREEYNAGYPLEKMLAAGVAVALGTDGRGSSPDLSLFDEMRCVARRYPTVSRDRILRMGTLGGAAALGRSDDLGTLEVGKRADLTIIALPDREAADPHELLFDPAASVVGCRCRGISSPGAFQRRRADLA